MLAQFHETDKGPRHHNYTPLYYEIFQNIERRYGLMLKPRILEIGIDTGAALRLFREYLGFCNLFGIDILDLRDEAATASAHFAQGDAEDVCFLREVFPGERFDLVIDDASHRVAGWRAVVAALLPRVNPGGFLILEDLHVWRDKWETGDVYDEFFTDLVFMAIMDPLAMPSAAPPWCRCIQDVTFLRNLCVIRRNSYEP